MFKKIISQLSLSPASVEQVARYSFVVRRRARLYTIAAIIFAGISLLYLVVVIIQPTLSHFSYQQDRTTATSQAVSDFQKNLTLGISSPSQIAGPGQTVIFNLTISNPSNSQLSGDIWLDTRDLSEYALLSYVSNSGIQSSSQSGVLWSNITLSPGENQQLSLHATINSPITDKSTSTANPASHDCNIAVAFGNQANVAIKCPFSKKIEQTFAKLPNVNYFIGLATFSLLTLISLAASLANRLRYKEIKIIRSQINTGDTL